MIKTFRVTGFLAVSLISLLSSCAWWQEKSEDKVVPFAVVNVLDQKLYTDCHIKSKYSVNVEMDKLLEYADKHWDKDTTHIIVYCANYMCTASGESAKLLKDAGYKHVWAYEGGTAEWHHLGYPVEGVCKAGYLKQYEKPEEYKPDVPVVTAQELQQMVEKFEKQ